MNSKFSPDQKVQVRPYGGTQWRDAIVSKPSPYPKAKCDGAYVTYDPLPPMRDANGCMPSMGGWYSENSIRDRQN